MAYRLKKLLADIPPDVSGTDSFIDIQLTRNCIVLGVRYEKNPDHDPSGLGRVRIFVNGTYVCLPDKILDIIYSSPHVDYTDFEISGVVQVSTLNFPSGYEYPAEGSGTMIESLPNTMHLYVLERTN